MELWDKTNYGQGLTCSLEGQMCTGEARRCGNHGGNHAPLWKSVGNLFLSEVFCGGRGGQSMEGEERCGWRSGGGEMKGRECQRMKGAERKRRVVGR